MWYSWPSIEAFDSWHSEIKSLLGIPFPGRNSETGEVELDAQWTTAYTQPVVVSETDVRAFVEDRVVGLSPALIGVASEQPMTAPEKPAEYDETAGD